MPDWSKVAKREYTDRLTDFTDKPEKDTSLQGSSKAWNFPRVDDQLYL